MCVLQCVLIYTDFWFGCSYQGEEVQPTFTGIGSVPGKRGQGKQRPDRKRRTRWDEEVEESSRKSPRKRK